MPFDSISSLSTKAILSLAADIMEERGHCKYSYFKKTGEVCCHTAIHLAAGGKVDFDEETFTYVPMIDAGYEAKNAFEQMIAFPVGTGICGWNNAHTKEEAVAALRSCAATYKGDANAV